jgi:hypothetical protein
MASKSLEAVEIQCPCCGELVEILVDCSVEEQSYTEDCQVCCRPMQITVILDEEAIPQVTVQEES